MPTYFFLILLLFGIKGFAQSQHPDEKNVAQHQTIPTQFDHLSVKDGLSNNSVNCIFQDREGFMWFGTNDGLNKYDGYTFTTLQPNLNNPARSFQNSLISGLCESYDNRLWVATQGGLHEVDKRTGEVIPHLIKATDAERWNFQHSVFEDSQQVLWISTLSGVARYEPALHRFTLFRIPNPEATIKTVFEDPQHRLWVGTYQGLYVLDQQTGRFTLVPVSVPAGVAQPSYMAFHMDRQQRMWIATSTAGYGLFRLDLTKKPWHLEHYNPDGQINPFTFLNSLHIDAAGILWLATTTGLQRIDPVRNQVYTYRPDPNEPKGISSNTAQTIYRDRVGTLWVGTDNGIDRQIMNNKPFMTYQIRPNRGTANLPENKVVALLPDHKGNFWISNGYSVYKPSADGRHSQLLAPKILGSNSQFKNYMQVFAPDNSGGVWLGAWSGLYHFDQKTGHFTSYPAEVPGESVSQGPTGDIWIGGYVSPENGVASFNPHTHQYTYYRHKAQKPDGLPDQYVNGLMASKKGDVWVAFRKQGLGRLNPKNGQFRHYMAGAKSGLNDNDIQAIYEDNTGTLWVGTQQGGLNRFDPQTASFSAITTRNGLLSNNIVGITSDQAGNLWLSTDKGLCRFNPATKVVRTYQTTNGLPSNDFLRNAVFRQKDRLYFGSLNGVVYFNPDSIRDDTRPFPVYITELKVRDQIRPITSQVITLNHDENFLSFSFAALTYSQSESNRYAYQLVGVDQDWVQNGNRHFVNYTNLSPGEYTFRVKAANSDGIWNTKGTSIQVVILPPWWATWWAYGIYALLLIGVIWVFIRFYTNRIRQQQELELNRWEAEQLKTVDELKTRFFSNITHEFRTPLSLILSPVEKLLQDNRFNGSSRQTLLLIQRNADQLLRLINQLLDLSKLEARRMDTSLMRGDVTDFVNHMVESFRPIADQKGVRLIYSADPIPQEYLFDADQWEKILTNLLSNALKFTAEAGQVTVTLQPIKAPLAEDLSGIHLQIADTGIGIAPEHLSHIFDRFYQVDTSRTRAYEGTGIGLALVKELVDLIKGAIKVESQPGVGTTFDLLLLIHPVKVNEEAPSVVLSAKEVRQSNQQPDYQLASISKPSITDAESPLVLIVEDNAELREFLAGELAVSYRILKAADGEAGWQIAQVELPDIVISDVMMPRMDGYELTRLIKNNAATDHIAVIMLTAKAAHHSRIEGLQEGADDYLAKPFHLDELHLRLRNLTSRQQKLRDQYQQHLAQPDTTQATDLVQDPFLSRIYLLLEAHLSDPSLDVDWLADQVAMSRKTLYRKINSLVQLAPNELIRQYRLRKAADLLRAGHNASQTAYLVGFKTPSYFTIVFKEFYHKTPTEFVQTSLNKV